MISFEIETNLDEWYDSSQREVMEAASDSLAVIADEMLLRMRGLLVDQVYTRPEGFSGRYRLTGALRESGYVEVYGEPGGRLAAESEAESRNPGTVLAGDGTRPGRLEVAIGYAVYYAPYIEFGFATPYRYTSGSNNSSAPFTKPGSRLSDYAAVAVKPARPFLRPIVAEYEGRLGRLLSNEMAKRIGLR